MGSTALQVWPRNTYGRKKDKTTRKKESQERGQVTAKSIAVVLKLPRIMTGLVKGDRAPQQESSGNEVPMRMADDGSQEKKVAWSNDMLVKTGRF